MITIPKVPEKNFVVRPAKKSDLPAVVKMSHGVSEIENFPGQKMKVEDFIHFTKGDGALMLVAESRGTRRARSRSAGEVVGYITVYQSENYFYLPYAVTKKGWRRHGVGGALLERVEALAKEAKVEYILMSVYVYNLSVHTFLKERGYTASKRLIQYSKIIAGKKKK
ncbi:MAG TPA: GNAT family N-acetyltransferase [Candidatus Acidoferrales bacterium]|nr:GNAT family N-acetyltransferase [Candidatus Acidoferrales bacterium]